MTRRKTRLRNLARTRWPSPGVLVVIAAMVLLAVGGAIRRMHRHDELTQWRQALESNAGRPPWPDWSPWWSPLPQLSRGRPRLLASFAGPYAFAARRPDVLGHVPCYCGCVRAGHHSNLSCFIDSFRANDAPVWTAHSLTCEMCVHIAREAMLMTTLGMPVDAIATEIDKRYGGAGLRTDAPKLHVPGHHER